MTVAVTTERLSPDSGANRAELTDRLTTQLNRALRGKDDVLDLVLICLLSGGHLLLEDRPGTGKTTLAKAIATVCGGRFARVQCTPDLLPSDVTGFNIFNQKSREFEFREGPVFSNILLADELNRATPRTQSALLEAMAERQVTVDTKRYELPGGFFVIATQNPVDQYGTYPLPEAQLDRFGMKLEVGYPGRQDEIEILGNAVLDGDRDRSGEAEPVLEPGKLGELQRAVARVQTAETIRDYLVRVAEATREHPKIPLGVSPRGLLAWQRAAQATAFLRERDYVTPDDVQHVLHPCLSVRLGLTDDYATIMDELVSTVPLPEYRLPR